MTPQRLLQHFDRISDAPDAIPRLRRFILDLAVRGMLVEQDPRDEPASELLKRIQAEKDRLVKEGMIRRENQQDEIEADEIPFPLPDHWAWVRLGSVIHLVSGQHLQPSEYSGQKQSGPPYITGPADFGKDGLVITRYAVVRKAVANIGQILLTVKGAGVGKTAICDLPEVAISRQLMALTAIEWSQEFLLLVTHRLAKTLKESARSLIPGISREDVDEFIFALPPLAEQHCIVARVDELMALCDRLEAAQAERESRRDRLATASLQQLNNGADADALREQACFYFNHLPRLTTRIEHIHQLRQTILNLAVIGKLTERLQGGLDAHDELLAVDNKKRELVLRKAKPIMPIAPEEEWCDLPNRWVWARWDQITDWITYGFTRPMPHEEHGVPIVTGKNVNYGRIIFETAERTTKEAYVSLNDKDRPKPGDILVTKDGSIGRSAIVTNEESFCINQSVAVLWLRSCHFNKQFLQLAIDCPQTQQSFLAKTEGVAIKHISVIDLGKMVFPLPPLAEQQRIVAKVDELMALCDRLEAQLTTTHTESRRLLEAILQDILNVSHQDIRKDAVC